MTAPTAFTTVLGTDHVTGGRVIEARGENAAGGRIFHVDVIRAGESRNGRNYPGRVLEAAAPMYEGAKAYDHHRSTDEMRSSTISGLIGFLRNVEADHGGIRADLHLLPGANHAAEALDASLAAQEQGLPPLVGLSHDVQAHFAPAGDGRRTQEAVKIVNVNSVDVVADPAAGGQATRVVAGGTEPEPTTETTGPTTAELLDRIAHLERAQLRPTATAQVTQEAHAKKIAALDAMVGGQPGGYRSIREAYLDFTGARVRFLDEDLNRRILQESSGFDSGMRATESMTTSSWNLALGDSVTRALIAAYNGTAYQDWRRVVSQISYGLDFRTQRRDRVGGYGVLPAVNQGAPYQPLTSPGNEEATYSITKRGGTEDVTLEMIANDDVRALANIPRKLGRSAALTLYRFVFDMLLSPGTTSYDSQNLFTVGAPHSNSGGTTVLSQAALSTARIAMRKQAAYGDTADILSVPPRYLVVNSTLEELGWQLVTSLVAIPSSGVGPADIPNLHHTMELVVVDYTASATTWFVVADPAQIPTIELGFYTNSPDPELFTQSDPSVGSMFDSDKYTYKVRHIYSGTVIDHRGLYRGNT